MSKRLSILFTAIALAVVLIVSPVTSAFASIADGSYEINYEMKEARSDNTSIADGYFSKPAKLIVENGTKHIQLTLTGADMIKELTAPTGPVQVISENKENNSRVVKFRVDGDLSQPVTMKMHIVVPDMYDMEHSARAVFDLSGLPKAGSEAKGSETKTDEKSETVVENPQTGDRTPIALYVTLLIGSVAIFTVYRLRVVKN